MDAHTTIIDREDHAGDAIDPTPKRSAWRSDPLSPDRADDAVVVTTERRLLRLVVAAVDAAARFEREGAEHDPAAWMLTPRAMFGGRPAIEACQDLRGCLRATVLNGLSLGLDADPADLDDLLDETPTVEAIDGRSVATRRRWNGPRLLSAWIDTTGTDHPGIQFCAMVTADPLEFAKRLIDCFGADAAGAAEVEIGFDRTSARATGFISEAMTEVLALAAADPASSFAEGLDIVVAQRFAA